MTTDFTQLNLHPQLVQAVVDCGYAAPMPIQAEIIPVMITGQDVIGQAQTGTGKTAAYALPILNNLDPDQACVQSLILVPTRELALQVADALGQYSRNSDVRVLAVYGGAPYPPQIRALRMGVDIVVGTPGRLQDLMRKNILDISQVSTVVLDEADEMLSMGFVEDMELILAQTPAERQTALFSATMSNEIRRLAEKYMRNPKSITIQREQVTVDAIEQRYYLVNEGDKLAALTRLIEMEDVTSALIFARTRLGTGELANELTSRGFPAEVLNGDLSQDAREQTMNRFRQGKITMMVATDVAARGLDIDDISHVFNFDLPDDPEIYVHRIGRTGRAGKTGIAISIVSPSERRLLRQVEGFTRKKIARAVLPTEEEIRTKRETALTEQLAVWIRRGRCRREREMLEQMVAQGFDAFDVAAAALKMARAEEKQRPIAPVTEVVETPQRSYGRGEGRYDSRYRGDRGRDFQPRGAERYAERSDRPERGDSRERYAERGERPSDRFQSYSTVSHESGMVRLSLNIGRKDGIRPNDIVGALAFHANIPGNTIGKIYIQDSQSLVDVPENLVSQVLGRAQSFMIRKQPVDLQRA